MSGFIDIASRILSQAEGRVEIAAQNIANANTPSYKRRLSFASVMAEAGSSPEAQTQASTIVDFTPGKPIHTGNSLDITVIGDGFLAVRTPTGLAYLRGGQFQRDSSGRVVTADGYPLQLQGGGDLTAKSGDFQVQSDGAVVEGGEALGKLALFDLVDRQAARREGSGLFRAEDANVVTRDGAVVRQGSLEASNVSAGEEMVSVMEALRRAESGQRLVTIYDDLMGRVLSTFGQA
ncbi:MAG: flagellar hook basal-body protein [Caulobacteraceae bacterium]|nr:flagellar hook basal-body protein [Caulobacteraceae bacterium]